MQATTSIAEKPRVESLTSLASHIAEEHRAACGHARQAVEHAEIAIAAFDRILDQGSLVLPSRFQPWSANFGEYQRLKNVVGGAITR